MADRDPVMIGMQPCGCVTVVECEVPPRDGMSKRSFARIVKRGGQVLTTTLGEAKAMPNFLPSECPHDPKGWSRA